MNKREDALKEALQKNEEEIERWQTYLKENETAIENMTMFSKRLSVDVMVPVGTKALMPGHLIHTNEVLVGHYQGYFSKCTAFKAKEICELVSKWSKDHLKKLETEADLWQKTYVEGVVPTGEERDIIEDEEAEKLWKEKHRLSLKQAKQKEREEREKQNKKNSQKSKEKTDDEILKMLEEAELMEELEQELDTLDVEEVNDETIRKLMSGEMKLPPEKKRISYENEISNENNDKRALTSNIVKKNKINDNLHPTTNNNVQANPEIANLINTEVNEMEEEPLPEEVSLIKEQAKFLAPEDQIGFYEYQIEIIRQKLQVLPLRSQEQLDEKIRLLNVLENLEELLESAEETNSIKSNCKPNVPPKLEKPVRDIIRLNDDDEDYDDQKQTEVCSTPQLDKKDLIQAKVEKSCHNMFRKSNQERIVNANDEPIDIPGSPADVYDLYVKSQETLEEKMPTTLFINSYEGEDQVKAPVLKETERKAAFMDPRAEFSNPTLLSAKPILKNKSAVENEIHSTEPKQKSGNKKSKKGTKPEEDESLSAYFKVMNDVVEKPLTEPEPLPNGKFIDAHAPKKRVSRFKQMRQGTEKT
ncbi:hypothetical protein DOY81_013557 [Sarcophaga bullata]|nr:hypothetical protein DOY81_013557 [Sarcophaga bullata]